MSNVVALRNEAVNDDQIIEQALGILAKRCAPGEAFSSPHDIRRFLQLKLGARKNECFGVIFLDSRHRLLRFAELFEGTIDGANIHPRVVVQHVFEVSAAAVVLYHNHPSGITDPSAADRSLTTRLKEALALIDVRVLDHFIVSASNVYSFAEHGLI